MRVSAIQPYIRMRDTPTAFRMQPNFRGESKKRPEDNSSRSTKSSSSLHGNFFTRLFDSPGKNFAWAVGLAASGGMLLIVPPAGIMLLAASAIPLLRGIGQLVSKKSNFQNNPSENEPVNSGLSQQESSDVEAVDRTSSQIGSEESHSIDQQMQSLLGLKTYDRLSELAKSGIKPNQAEIFLKEFKQYVAAIPSDAQIYGDMPTKTQNQLRKLIGFSLGSHMRTLEDWGREQGMAIGMSALDVEKRVQQNKYGAELPTATTEQEKRLVHQEYADIRRTPTGRITNVGSAPLLRMQIQVSGVANDVPMPTTGGATIPTRVGIRSNLSETDYVIDHGRDALGSIHINDQSKNNAALEIEKFEPNPLGALVSREALLTQFLQLAVEEGYIRNTHRIQVSVTNPRSSQVQVWSLPQSDIPTLRKFGFKPSGDDGTLILEGDDYLFSLKAAMRSPVTSEFKRLTSKVS